MRFLRRTFNTIFIMLGSGCNFQCKYCMQHPLITTPIKAEMNPDVIEFLKDIMENQEQKLRIMFFGGEPLLYWDNIVHIVESLPDDKFTYGMVTNGSLLTQDKVNFLNAHNIGVAVSWDGRNTKNTRGYDVFDSADFRELFFSLNSPGISAVLSAESSIMELMEFGDVLSKDFIDYRLEHNLLVLRDFITINIDEIMDTGLEHKYLTDVDIRQVMTDMTRLCEGYMSDTLSPTRFTYINGMVNYLRENVQREGTFSLPRCGNGYSVLNVDLAGNLYGCHNSGNKVGTIYDGYLTYLSKIVMTHNAVREECNACPVQYICHNGCPLISKEVRERYYCNLKRAVYYPVIEMLLNLGGENNGR